MSLERKPETNKQVRRICLFLTMVLCAGVLFAAGCGGEDSPEGPLVIVEVDAATDSGIDDVGSGVDDIHSPSDVEDTSHDVATEQDVSTQTQNCERWRQGPVERVACQLNADCTQSESCGYEPDNLEVRLCLKYCYPEVCDDMCDSNQTCEPLHDTAGQPVVDDDGYAMGRCLASAPAESYELCRTATCGEGFGCVTQRGINSDRGWCSVPCNPAAPDCPDAAPGFPMECVSQTGKPSFCEVVCDPSDADSCPDGTECRSSNQSPGRCMPPEVPCLRSTCSGMGANCGTIDDGCGRTINCPSCPAGQSCEENECVCIPTSCEQAGATCGMLDDGCGELLECGECLEEGEACGAQGVPNQCGCEPSVTCESAGVDCGTVDDGCGLELVCELCTGLETCGGAGVPDECGCTPSRSCESQNRECGSMTDGCGESLNCGSCDAGSYCDSGTCQWGCDAVRQLGCPASNERCIFNGSSEVCAPLSPTPKSDGQTCEPGECRAGSACLGAFNSRVCRSYCHSDGHCLYGDCVYSLQGSATIRACSNSCNALSPTACNAGQGCYVFDTSNHQQVTDCMPAGGRVAGSFCSSPSECQAGLTCFNSSCHRICSPGSMCADGSFCVDVQNWWSYGLCAP